LSCSIDHYGERAEYLRKGTDWGVIESNLLAFRDLTYIDFQINTVFSIFNYPTIGQFYQYLKDKNIIRLEDWYHSLYLAVHPPYFSAKSLPAPMKAAARQAAMKFCESNTEIGFGLPNRLITDGMNFADSEDTWEENKKTFFTRTFSIDKIREEDLYKVFPELSPLSTY